MARSNSATATAENVSAEATATDNTDSDSNEDEDDGSIEFSEPMDVTDPKLASALLAAWRGVYHFFKGRVTPTEEFPTGWEITADGNVIAHGFKVASDYDADNILRDISGRDRRVDFGPAYLVVNGAVPEPYTEASEMTNFMVNYTKGSESGTSKTPEYVRKAVASYKAEIGLRGRRGRKRTIIRLDQISKLDPETLSNVAPADLATLIEYARAAAEKQTANPVAASDGATTASV